MLESTYQGYLIRTLKQLLPGCIVLKNDTSYLQGFPDLTILYREMWAVLEVKASIDSPVQPNQEYYIHMLGQMSFAAFIFPENEVDVLDGLQQAFESAGAARLPLG